MIAVQGPVAPGGVQGRSPCLLAVEGLSKRFGGVTAARDVAFELAAGEMLAIIGPNGAGKSTVFNMVGGQLRPDAGRVLLAGEDVTGRAPRALSRRGVGRTFQVAQTFLSMTVLGNVQMALIADRRGTLSLWPEAASLHREEALALLARVGMAEAASRGMGELAYGDVKRVELAIALAGAPRLLLMDEPTAGMAPGERAALMALTAGIARGEGIGVLFTEHDMDAVFAHADRILVLVRGEVIAAGSPAEVRADPEVRRVYLGESGSRAAARAARHG
jgi:branched-chain amino acid transport system ATP-binding protein